MKTPIEVLLPASLAASLLNSQRWREVAPFARSASCRVRCAVAAFSVDARARSTAAPGGLGTVPVGAWDPDGGNLEDPLTRVNLSLDDGTLTRLELWGSTWETSRTEALRRILCGWLARKRRRRSSPARPPRSAPPTSRT